MSRPALELPHPPCELRPGDPGWPPGLGELDKPPTWLRVCGTLPALDRAVAVVGTRYADPDGLDFARELAGELTAFGVVVVSGGAEGIDAAAHQGALERGGSTVAVLASGFRRPYPAANGPLFERIARTGALVTEADEGRIPHRGRFLERNRLVAAMTRATVVVQAPVRSGALSTAGHARALARPVFAVPGAPWDPRAGGTLELLQRGMRICTCARDVLSVLALAEGSKGGPRQNPENSTRCPDLGPDGQRIWAALGSRARHVDEVAREAGLTAARAQRTLLEMELLGVAEERAPGRYARRPFREPEPVPD
jgi:DNA processing protein